MNDVAVREIERLALLGKEVEAGDERYVHKDLQRVPREYRVKAPVALRSLSGLVGYLEADIDGIDSDGVLVHVQRPTEVAIVSALSEIERARDAYATATCSPRLFTNQIGFALGEWAPLETFNIALQALFEDSDDRAKVLRITGNVSDENVRTATDDGVTQRVAARAGIVKAEEVDVPNPVTLRPFRTFTEVEQPSSVFILRLKVVSGGFHAALFEADGGAWQQEAVESIRFYLDAKLPDHLVIA